MYCLGPGAGKGTQCEKLSEEFGIKHLSAGELLREEQRKPTEYGRIIDSLLKDGKIVPVEISLSLLHAAIRDLNWNRYLIDGFPRNWDNLEGWNKQMLDICDLESVLFIDCQEDQMESRILSRGQSSGRDDDNLVSARKRFATFKRESMPVVEHLKQQLGDKVCVINGDSDIASVYAQLRVPILTVIERELVELTSQHLAEQQQQLTDVNKMEQHHVRYSISDPVVLIRGKKASVRFHKVEEVMYHCSLCSYVLSF
jgi:UMP-CMP kinase